MSADSFDANDEDYAVGYRSPPLHTRFQPGVSGNPAGRRKGTPNLKTILEQVLREQIALREGNVTKKISKAEAIIRGLVIGAMKSDSRSQMTLFRLAEQVGQFEVASEPLRVIERVIVDPRGRRDDLLLDAGTAEDAA
jgi:hypothetical protein